MSKPTGKSNSGVIAGRLLDMIEKADLGEANIGTISALMNMNFHHSKDLGAARAKVVAIVDLVVDEMSKRLGPPPGTRLC